MFMNYCIIGKTNGRLQDFIVGEDEEFYHKLNKVEKITASQQRTKHLSHC